MKMSAQDIWKHITHLITLWEDPWSPQNCSKIPKWKMRVVSAWVSRVQCYKSILIHLRAVVFRPHPSKMGTCSISANQNLLSKWIKNNDDSKLLLLLMGY